MKTQQTLLAILVFALSAAATPASARDSYQERVLFSPSAEMLQAEARGRVMIYDGLKIEMVEKALDIHFDRIENMMFVRTLHLQEDGEYVAEDDCD